MDENYILELLRMPQSTLAKMVWGLQEENKDLEGKLFYSRMCARAIIDGQRCLIEHLSNEVEIYRAKDQ